MLCMTAANKQQRGRPVWQKKEDRQHLCFVTSITIDMSVVSCKADIYLWNTYKKCYKSGKRHQVLSFQMSSSELSINFFDMRFSKILIPICVQH